MVETEEVSNKTVSSQNKAVGGVQVLPSPTTATSPDSRPSWLEEFSRKKANRKSGIFAEKSEDDSGGGGSSKPEKPTPPKAETKPSIAHKPEHKPELVEMRKNLTRDKSQTGKVDSIKTKLEEAEPVKERPARPSLPPSLLASSQGEKKGSGELARKLSDSSRHSERPEKPAVHSTNLGNPEKFSFAKPERPAMDKVMAKNDKNVAKTEGGETQIGWKSDIISNRVTDITNGYKSLQEKENISGPCSCKEVIEEFPK